MRSPFKVCSEILWLLDGLMDIAIILGLILINGVFAMSEIAIVSSRQIRLQQAADAGHEGARRALQLSREPTRFLSTIQVGITLIGILAGAFGESSIARRVEDWLNDIPWLADYAGPLSWVIMVIIITYLSLIFGELVPKRLAMMNPELIARTLSRPMHSLSRIAHPLVWLLSTSTELIIRLLRIEKRKEAPIFEEEIHSLVTQGTAEGALEHAEHDMLKNILRLDEQRVGTIMTLKKDMCVIDLDDDDGANLIKIADSPHSRIPVCRGDIDVIVGVLCKKEFLKALLTGAATDIESLVKPVPFVTIYTTTLELLEELRSSGAQVAIVHDGHDQTAGIVTMTDVMAAIVGDMAIEEDAYTPDFLQREDGSWLVNGQVDIGAFKDRFGLKQIPDEEENRIHSVAGMVFSMLGRVPREGDAVTVGNLRIEVIDMDGHRLDKALVTSLETPIEITG